MVSPVRLASASADIERAKALLDSSLERAADRLGDITPHVMSLLYSRFPEARERFETLYPGGRERLEQEMVEQALFCLMEWLNDRAVIEIILTTTIPHHAEVLAVAPKLFSGLVTAVCDTITATIPAHETAEHAVWAELHAAIQAQVEAGALQVR